MAIEKNIYIYKVHEGLYRVRNNEKKTTKDVRVVDGKVLPTENDYNILTPLEQRDMDIELF